MTITFHRGLRQLSPDRLLFRQYKLTPRQRLVMLGWAVALSQLAAPVGSSVYFILTQTRIVWSYPKQGAVLASGYLGDAWDRLPVHVENLLHAHWFPGQAAPPWWVTARHDARHVLIGFMVALLIGSVTIGLKQRKRATFLSAVLSIPLALLAAAVVATPLILASSHMGQLGLSTGNPWLADWLGKGSTQLLIIGLAAGFAAKPVLARTLDTVQLLFLERRLLTQYEPQPWYPPNYRDRFRLLVAQGHTPPVRGHIPAAAASLFMSALALATPVFLFLLGYGIWLLYFGFAVNASH
jgi:hypothetical protein